MRRRDLLALAGPALLTHAPLRAAENGVTDKIAVPLESGLASACVLGGTDRKTLYMTVGVEVFDFEKSAREALGALWVADVAHSGGATRP